MLVRTFRIKYTTNIEVNFADCWHILISLMHGKLNIIKSLRTTQYFWDTVWRCLASVPIHHPLATNYTIFLRHCMTLFGISSYKSPSWLPPTLWNSNPLKLSFDKHRSVGNGWGDSQQQSVWDKRKMMLLDNRTSYIFCGVIWHKNSFPLLLHTH